MDGMDEIVQCLSTLSKGQAKAIFAGLTAWGQADPGQSGWARVRPAKVDPDLMK